jgi:hypothetical protein
VMGLLLFVALAAVARAVSPRSDRV